MSAVRRGVLVTLEPARRTYARDIRGPQLNATYDEKGDVHGHLSPGTRVCAAEAEGAVEQLLEHRSGTLRSHGADTYYSPNMKARRVYVSPTRHRGRVYFVLGPLDDEATYLVVGSITVTKASTRPLDEKAREPAHVWRDTELDDPPPPRGTDLSPAKAKPEQALEHAEPGGLFDAAEGRPRRPHDEEVA